MSEPKAHADYAPSSSKRWMNCRACIKRSKNAPEQKSGPASEEGTDAHELMEICFKNKVRDVYSLFQKGGMLAGTKGEKYDRDMRKTVQEFIEWVYSLVLPGYELIVETKVHLKAIHPKQAFGTVDVAIIEPFGTLHVIDLKYGQMYVDHNDNSQMIFYALGIAQEHGFDFENIKTTIYQPRAGSSETIRSDEFSVAKLRSWLKIFKDAVKACEAADENDTTAGEWCMFCPAKIDCPALSLQLFQEAQLDFKAEVQPDPKNLSPAQLQAILDRSAYLYLWINEVKKYAKEQIEKGKKIKGWKLVPTKAQRKWADADKVKKMKISDLIVESQLVSPAQAEAVLKKIWDKKYLQSWMRDNVVAVSSGTKLESTNNDFSNLELDD